MTNAKIAVIGAGLMGHGIAQVFALAGHDVTITDCVRARLSTRRSPASPPICAISARTKAPRKACAPAPILPRPCARPTTWSRRCWRILPLKQKLFAEIERHVRPDTILASNTSVIPITAIMQGLTRRERALGTHWWNPPFLVPLVEVIETQWTSAGNASPGR